MIASGQIIVAPSTRDGIPPPNSINWNITIVLNLAYTSRGTPFPKTKIISPDIQSILFIIKNSSLIAFFFYLRRSVIMLCCIARLSIQLFSYSNFLDSIYVLAAV